MNGRIDEELEKRNLPEFLGREKAEALLRQNSGCAAGSAYYRKLGRRGLIRTRQEENFGYRKKHNV